MTDLRSPVFNKRYELINEIARGGTAQVYLARDVVLNRPVALKVLFAELSTDEAFVRRFRREAQAAANLSHHNIVPVFDWGESEHTYFIVMEYVKGETLSSVIRTSAPIPADRATRLAIDIADALSYAHDHGVVHRDVKPGNVLIAQGGAAKVTDFGIARAIGDVDQQLTQTGLVMGTAAYFSPEQAQGLELDGRTDIYALGVVLYEMLTGRPPFAGETPISIAFQHVRDEPPLPRSINPAIPPALEAIVLRAMAKHPDQRYASAGDLRSDLERVLHAGPAGAGIRLPERLRTSEALDTSELPVAPAVGRRRKHGLRSRARLWVALAAALLVTLCTVAYFGARHYGYLGGGRDVTVPKLLSFTESDAISALEARGLRSDVRTVPGVVGTTGRVVAEEPNSSATVKRGSLVTLSVGGIPPRVTVPRVTGLSEPAALQRLNALGFVPKVAKIRQTNPSQIQGDIARQFPEVGVALPKGSTVRITIVNGSLIVTVPSWSNLPSANAGGFLQKSHLKIGTTTFGYSSSVPLGDVITSNPPSGTSVRRGTTVNLVESGRGVPIPPVIGQASQEAETLIQSAQLQFEIGRAVGTQDPTRVGEVAEINCETPVDTNLAPKYCTTGTMVGLEATINLRIFREEPGSTTTTTAATAPPTPAPTSSTVAPAGSSPTPPAP